MKREAIFEALRYVEDPDLKKDLVSLGMIQDLEIKGDVVSFRLVLTTPACPMKDHLKRACTQAIWQMVNKDAKVEIALDSSKSIGKDASELEHIEHIVAVYSAKGGVGKSTVAANLALTLAKQGASVGILDADIYGPSIPSIFGIGDVPIKGREEGGKKKMIPIEKYGVHIMSLGLLTQKKQAIVWRGPMASTATKQLVNDVCWPALDYLIVDMPPGTGDIHLTLAQTLRITGTVIVTTPQEVAVNDSRRAISMLLMDSIHVPIVGLVENMSYFTPPELPDKKYYLFGKEGGKRLAQEFGLILLGEIPIAQQIGDMQDKGSPYMLRPEGELITASYRAFVEKVVRVIAMKKASVHQVDIVNRMALGDTV